MSTDTQDMLERMAHALAECPAIPRGRPGALPRDHNIRAYWRMFDRWVENHGDTILKAQDILDKAALQPKGER